MGTTPKIVALLDACVLYPPSLRDLLMRLAAARVYAPRWTEEIHAEWIRSVLANNEAVTPAQLDRTRQLMDTVAPDCLVSGFEARLSALILLDANDRHVLAAAIESRAPLIVTYNLADFPNAALRTHGVQAIHPDDFLVGLFDEDPALFLGAVQTHRAALRHPPKDAAGYVQTLRANRLKELALRLEANLSRF